MSLPKMASHSFDPREALLTELRQKFPEVFTESEIDLEKMQNFLQSKFSDDKDRYRMTWAGRKEAIRQVQVKTTNTFVPDVEKSVDFDNTRNMFVEGDNLEVLRVLQKSYYGKVKMIYIDPPYNTGNDFIYNDNYLLEKTIGQKDAGIRNNAGHLNDDSALIRSNKNQGHYHSDWLTMIFPRLYLGKNLMRQDGVICVSIDDNEAPRLRLLMDEIFGEENFIANIVVQTNPRGRTLDRFLAKTFEYILVYSKSIENESVYQISKDTKGLAEYKKVDESGSFRELELRNRNPVFNRANRPNLYYPLYINPENSHVSLAKDSQHCAEALPVNSKKDDGCWTWSKKKVGENIDLLLGKKVATGMWRVYRKDYIPENGAVTKAKALWLDKNMNHENGKEEMGKLFGKTPFDFPKSVDLIKMCISIGTKSRENDLILDFFAGSGTTAHAVMKLNDEDGGNRKWICVQLDERCDQDSEAYKAGYETIADIARERIRRAGKKIQEANKGKTSDVGFKAVRLAKSNFPIWQSMVRDEHNLLEQMDLFANAQQHDAKPIDLLYEVILKEGLDINIDVKSKETSSGSYYLVNQGKLAVSFVAQLIPELMDAIFLEKPEKIILLESAFIGKDELKMNTALHAQTLKIDIRVI